jgi:hypothetical protein
MPELRVPTQRPQKCFLVGVFGGLAAEQSHEVVPDLLARLGVEPLEGWNRHGIHLLL